jgi:hypothetical protein
MFLDEFGPEIVKIVQQRVAHQLVGRRGRRPAVEQHGAADRNDLLLEQEIDGQAGTERRPAVADGEVDAVGLEAGNPFGRQDVEIELRMPRREIRQSRDQPFGGEGGRGADGEPHGLRPEIARRLRDDLEGPPDIGDIAPAFAGERQHARQALEEFDAEFRLQPAYLLGDRTLRHAQFLGREAEVQMACRDLEDPETVERGKCSKRIRHAIVFLQANESAIGSSLRLRDAIPNRKGK